MASRNYNKGITEIGNGGIDYLTDTIKVMLVNSAYAHNPDSNFVSDIVASEITVGGYARLTLGTKTVTKDDTNDRAVFDGADSAFGALAAGQTIGGAVVFKDTGADATSPLISFNDSTDTATNGGTITFQWAATGIFYGQI